MLSGIGDRKSRGLLSGIGGRKSRGLLSGIGGRKSRGLLSGIFGLPSVPGHFNNPELRRHGLSPVCYEVMENDLIIGRISGAVLVVKISLWRVDETFRS